MEHEMDIIETQSDFDRMKGGRLYYCGTHYHATPFGAMGCPQRTFKACVISMANAIVDAMPDPKKSRHGDITKCP